MNAAPNTGNQGVSALCYSAVDGLAARGHHQIAVADHGRGKRETTWRLGTSDRAVELFGLSHTRRLWRADCLRTVRALLKVGGGLSPSAQTVHAADAVLDVSGGDSFTDLYGEKRFQAMVLTKRLALDTGKPLILLPQTLGPFLDLKKRAIAADILRAAHAVWVRDANSLALLKDMLGDDFDPARHRLGVDMALLLPTATPEWVPVEVFRWLRTSRRLPVIGLNVSGLLCQHAQSAQKQFGLAAPHTDQIEAAARAALASHPKAKLVLVPHVLRNPEDPESDWAAAQSLKARLGDDVQDRVCVLPQDYTAPQLKWIISQFDWFAGARMHATIAGFSSGVPTLGLGYSDKAAGVFEACGLGKHVVDLRTADAQTVGEVVAHSIENRRATRRSLQTALPKLLERAEAQMDAIAAQVSEVAA
ncbi:MAG: polysaccharide pyruvyl transferase family protein [Pseudomonadota bacterium]